ncbi:MAG: protein kinase [Sandaracinus sp.]
MQDVQFPARLGRYELLARIAAGGMAEVFAGRIVGDSGFAKLVAIKIMLEELLAEERFVTMFVDEARVAAHISDPHVVGILDLGRTERGVPYLVMDLVVGASVSGILKGDPDLQPAPMPLPLAIEIAAQAAEGLHAAHEARDALGTPLEIVHRDVSPQNILVGIDGRVRITDFGVARAVARLTRTESGEVKGKARYFSPEQAQGRAVDRRSDVFALGIVLWEMLALKPLFTGRTMADVLKAVVSQPVPDVREHRPDVPAEIVQVIRHALERSVEARVATGSELARELRQAAEAAHVLLPRATAIASYVETRAGQAIKALTSEIREHSSISVELPIAIDEEDTASHHGFSEEEPTTVDPLFVAGLSSGRTPMLRAPSSPAAPAAPASAPQISAPPLAAELAATIPESQPDPRMVQAVAQAVAAMKAAAPSAAAPLPPPPPPVAAERPHAQTLPLGAMATFPPVVPGAEVAAAQASAQGTQNGRGAQATQNGQGTQSGRGAQPEALTRCPRCQREVPLASLSFADDGSQICKSCHSAAVSEDGDRGAVRAIAGMGYGALFVGVLTLCMTWIPFLNLVPAVLAIASAGAFFVNVSRSPDHRRRMGWQLPVATIAAAIGLALGLLVPITYLLVLLGVAVAP